MGKNKTVLLGKILRKLLFEIVKKTNHYLRADKNWIVIGAHAFYIRSVWVASSLEYCRYKIVFEIKN